MTNKARFWSKVHRTTRWCWLWDAGCGKDGYGMFWLRGTTRQAHRVVWEWLFGPIPKGKCVLHKCDNPPCVNPMHLFLGTHRLNMKDRNRKGRCATGNRSGSYTKPETRRCGEYHGMSRLTAVNVELIRRAAARLGANKARIGRRFGVSRSRVSKISLGKSWM